MAYACDICGKGKQFGHNVPFSLKKTNKVWKPNLQKQYISYQGGRMQIKACAQCLRTLKKYQAEANSSETKSADAAKPKAAKKPAAKA